MKYVMEAILSYISPEGIAKDPLLRLYNFLQALGSVNGAEYLGGYIECTAILGFFISNNVVFKSFFPFKLKNYFYFQHLH